MVASGRAMSKKTPPVAARHVIWLSWKLVVFLSVALCLLALLRLHSSSSFAFPPSISRPISRISRDNLPFSGPPRIAFLFLSRLNLPLDFLWESFFEVFLPSFLPSSLCLSLSRESDSESSCLSVCLFVLFVCRMLTRQPFRFMSTRRRGLCSMSPRRGLVSSRAANCGIVFRLLNFKLRGLAFLFGCRENSS